MKNFPFHINIDTVIVQVLLMQAFLGKAVLQQTSYYSGFSNQKLEKLKFCPFIQDVP